MKTLRNLFLAAVVALTPLLTFGAANDIKISQSNSGGTAWIDRIFQPTGGTAITSVATFRTGLGLGTADSVTFGTVTTTTAFRGANGSAATPSYAFTNQTGDGFYSISATKIGLTGGGTLALVVGATSSPYVAFNSGETIYIQRSGSVLTATAISTSIALDGATNGNITFTPSGTGADLLVGPVVANYNSNVTVGTFANNSFQVYTASGFVLGVKNRNSGVEINAHNNTDAAFARLNIDATIVSINGQSSGYTQVAGNVLLNGLTVNGTGALQFATSAAASGGITFGTDSAFYRLGAGYFAFDSVGGVSPTIEFRENGVAKGQLLTTSGVMYLKTVTGASLILQTNGTTAFTIDTSQNATFAGTVTKIGGTYLLQTSTALTDNAAAQVGTLTNAPSAGNPTKWVAINDNGTSRKIPAWHHSPRLTHGAYDEFLRSEELPGAF